MRALFAYRQLFKTSANYSRIFSPAVLVRRHGTYSWGPDWTKAKGQAECLDYLLEVAVKMRLAGLKTEGL